MWRYFSSILHNHSFDLTPHSVERNEKKRAVIARLHQHSPRVVFPLNTVERKETFFSSVARMRPRSLASFAPFVLFSLDQRIFLSLWGWRVRKNCDQFAEAAKEERGEWSCNAEARWWWTYLGERERDGKLRGPIAFSSKLCCLVGEQLKFWCHCPIAHFSSVSKDKKPFLFF